MLVATLVGLTFMMLVVASVVVSGGRESQMAGLRLQAGRVDLAAEAVAQMAVKELMDNVDRDADGTIGAISNDGNTANDPVISNARAWASCTLASTTYTVTANAVSNDAVKRLTVTLKQGASGGVSVYWGQDANGRPETSTWNGTAWGTITELNYMNSASRIVRAKRGVGSSAAEITYVAVNAGDDLFVQYGPGGVFASAYNLANDVGAAPTQRFDLDFEQTSGRCVIVYARGPSLPADYRITSGGTLAADGNCFPLISGASYAAIRLAAKPGSNEVIAAAVDTSGSGNLNTKVWNGSSWGSSTLITSTVSSTTAAPCAVTYENSSGDGLIVYGMSGSSLPRFRTYIAGVWSTENNLTATAGVPLHFQLAAKPGSNEILCAVLDASNNISVYVWSGTAWSAKTVVSTASQTTVRRPMAVAYTPDGTQGIVAYCINGNSVMYRVYAAGAWGTEQSTATAGAQPMWNQLQPGASGQEVFLGTFTTAKDIVLYRWNGTTWSAATTVELSGATGNGGTAGNNEPFGFAAAPASGGGGGKPTILTWNR